MTENEFPRLPEYKDRLKFARKKAKLSQKALADRVGVSQAIISRLETGEDTKSSYTAQFAKECRVPAAWLATGELVNGWAKFTEVTIDSINTPSNNPNPPIKTWSEIIRSKGDGMFCYTYEGNLMTGQSGIAIPSGSLLHVDPSIMPTDGKSIVLASSDGRAAIGVYAILSGTPHVIPTNTQYPAIKIDADSIVGTVTKFEVSVG